MGEQEYVYCINDDQDESNGWSDEHWPARIDRSGKLVVIKDRKRLESAAEEE